MTALLAAAFREANRDGDAGLDARLLVAHALGIDAGEIVLVDDRQLETQTERLALGYVERRIGGEPVARIVGRKEFWGLDLVLSADTLVPRPDTETLVEAVLATADREAPLSILDLGTGSGAILLALLSELPQALGIGTDLSSGAIAVARGNASRLGLADRAKFVVADWASAIGGRFDLVVSNPPYIATEAIKELAVDVRDHDPHVALDGGADGLAAYRSILAELPRLMLPGGRAVLEIGFDQAEAVQGLGRQKGWRATLDLDLGGRARVVEVRG
jgi:release factor glutamine methyltransferase